MHFIICERNEHRISGEVQFNTKTLTVRIMNASVAAKVNEQNTKYVL